MNFMEEITTLLCDSDQIILCGHSNGMAAATLTSIIFLCFMNLEYLMNPLNIDMFDNFREKIIEKLPIYDFLSTKSLFVVGSGGFPLLFNNEQFELYYKFIKGIYIHIVNGIFNETTNKYYIDYFTRPYIDLENKKYGIYYYKYPFVSTYKIPYKYDGIQCFSNVVINDKIIKNDLTIENFDKQNEFLDCNEHLIDLGLDDDNCDIFYKQMHKFDTYRKIISPYFLN